MVSIRVDGDRVLIRQLERVPRRALEAIDDAVDTVSGQELRDLATYPAAPAGSTYVRTGELGRGWQHPRERRTFGAGGLSKQFTNVVDYAHFVQGEDQAWMHEGRWERAADIHERYQPRYERAAQQAVDRVSRGVG